jgi:hypothetical protein
MPKQVDKYDKERQDILNKIFSILGLGDNNNKFSLHKMDGDIEKQKAIIDLEGEIKKYFVCSKWTCFEKENKVKRRWLSMIRYIVKYHNYDIISTKKSEKSSESPTDTDKQYDTVYFINKKCNFS